MQLKKSKIIAISEKRLKESSLNFSKEQIDFIKKEIIGDLVEDIKVDLVKDMISFVERLFYKKYGPSKIFCDSNFITPSIRNGINQFIANKRLEEEDYKKFLEWEVEIIPSILNRSMNVYDMYHENLFAGYLENIGKDNKLLTEKKELAKKRILTAEPS